MSGFLEHITVDGDRWDQLAWQYYGDPHAYEGIIRANSGVPALPILPAGIRLVIPALDNTVSSPAAGLPPWMQP